DRIRSLETQLKDKKELALKTARRADELASSLQEAEARGKKLDQLIAGLRAENKNAKDKLAAVEMAAKNMGKARDDQLKEALLAGKNYQTLLKLKNALEADLATSQKELLATKKELADAQLTLGGLKLEKQTLASEVKQARADAENRFAGIALTG